MMEVRCCCDAGKLLGWLPVPRTEYARIVRFCRLELEPIELEVALVHTPAKPEGHFAYKSKDYPIELLRQIPGFVEATEYETALGKNQPLDFGTRTIVSNVWTSTRWPEGTTIPSDFGRMQPGSSDGRSVAPGGVCK